MTADGAPELRGSRDERAEHERLRRLDEAYSSSPYYRKIWQSESPASRLMADRKWALITALLRAEGLDVGSARVLDLGVGSGQDGARFKALGARPDRFVGLDFLELRAREAHELNPWMNTIVGDAGSLPLPACHFDLVYQSTMLSSVLQPERRERIFREIERILVRGGLFLSFDTRYPNPWNPHTRPLRAGGFRRAFPGWPIKVWSTTAIPQLQRALAPFSLAACRLLEGVPFLRSHLLVLARKI
jgi:SAM-dependent methyltransferase